LGRVGGEGLGIPGKHSAEMHAVEAPAGIHPGETPALGVEGRSEDQEDASGGDAMPAASLRIHALGPMRVLVGDREVPKSAWKRAERSLFTLLLSKRFHWVPTEEIFKVFWPKERPKSARTKLYQWIHRLRLVLEPELSEAQNSRYLLTCPQAVKLEPGAGYLYDVMLFERALARVDAAQDAEEKICFLREALALYTGDFAEDFPSDPSVSAHRAALRERCIRATSRLLAILSGAKRWDEVVIEARAGLVRDPGNEKLHVLLVTALREAGRRDEG
jgi:DNA-binding SARP family transcriptional activator